jgi:hypothetical protein
VPYLNGAVISDEDLQARLKQYRDQNAGAPADDQSIINFWESGQKTWGDGQVSATQPGPAAQWTTQQVQTQTPQSQARGDELYEMLRARASQAANVSANDPAIRSQSDAYAAEQTRASQNYLADLAEQGGPYANLRGEQRLAAERTGSNIAGFKAELMARDPSRVAMLQERINYAHDPLAGNSPLPDRRNWEKYRNPGFLERLAGLIG